MVQAGDRTNMDVYEGFPATYEDDDRVTGILDYDLPAVSLESAHQAGG